MNIIFEKNLFWYRVALPVMWMLTVWVFCKKMLYGLFGSQPSINTFWFDGLGTSCRGIKEGVASWKALDIIYKYPKGTLADAFWIGMVNAQAVRNRLKIVRCEIYDLAKHIALDREQEVRIFSIACGSAQAVIEVLVLLKQEGILAQVFLTDREQSALDYAWDLAVKNGVEKQVSFAVAKASEVEQLAGEFKPNIVEMVGLLDYYIHPKAVRLFRRVRNVLATTGGFFITCNVIPNPEMRFLKWVINWVMVYRSPKELESVADEAGFDKHYLLREPLNVHVVIVAEHHKE